MKISYQMKSLLACLVTLLMVACAPQKTNWELQYNLKSKDPYGVYLSYQSINRYFPQHKIDVLSPGFLWDNLSQRIPSGERANFIVVGNVLALSETEQQAIIDFANQGNNVLMAVDIIEPALLSLFNVVQHSDFHTKEKTSSCVSYKERQFCYQGTELLNNYISNNEGKRLPHEIISTNKDQQSTIVRYRIGEGNIIFCSSGIPFTNHFLLQNDNYRYLEGILSQLPFAHRTLWLSFDYRMEPKDGSWSALMKNTGFKLFIISSLILLLLYVLFNIRRKYRIIPIIAGNENTTFTFVETVGQLYFNKGNNKNLAQKLVSQFFEQIRTNFQINTLYLDEKFKEQLSYKSGRPIALVDIITEEIKMIRAPGQVSDDFLMSFYNHLQEFNNFNHGK